MNYKSRMNNSLRLLGCVSVCLLCSPAGLQAQTVTPNVEMSFGEFAIKNNNSRHALQVAQNNSYSADSAYAVITPPNRAEWSLTSFPASTLITISIPDATLTFGNSGTGEYFTVENFAHPATVTTDGSGSASFNFGATLYTSGSTAMYADGSFSGSSLVTLSW
jgi:hypothetical protein